MKSTHLTAAFGLAVTMLVAAPMVVAQTVPPPRGPAPFAMFDLNGDGVVTEQEFNRARAERRAALAAQGRPLRASADAPHFSDLDLNGDGLLTPDEIAAYRQSRMQGRGRGGMGSDPGMRGQGPGMGSGSGVGPRGGGNPGSGPPAAPMTDPGYGGGMARNMPTFAMFDLDGNGVLTKQEFEQARANRIKERSQAGYRMRNLATAPSFDELDRNGDGWINPGEFASGQARHHQRMSAQ